MTRSTRAALAALAPLAGALAVAAPAAAHVTLQPDEAPAGAYVVEAVRVPNERDDAATTRVDVQFPPGFEFASYAPVQGWEVDVESSGGEVRQVSFSGGRIEPGQFVDFPLSLKMPDTPGAALTFKAVQTYEGGEKVRWIGAPDSDEPAPQIRLLDAEGDGDHAGRDGEDAGAGAGGGAAAEGEAGASGAPAGADGDGGGGSDGLAIAALVVGGLGLAAGATGLAVARQARAAAV